MNQKVHVNIVFKFPVAQCLRLHVGCRELNFVVKFKQLLDFLTLESPSNCNKVFIVKPIKYGKLLIKGSPCEP